MTWPNFPPQISILFNVVVYHHECRDGSGRPCKESWSNDKTLAFLCSARGTKFYPSAVDALAARHAEVVVMQSQFAESLFD